jgi:replicative DNA helicase
MRRLIEAAEQIEKIGYEEDNELAEILDLAEKKIYDVTSKNLSGKYIQLVMFYMKQ